VSVRAPLRGRPLHMLLLVVAGWAVLRAFTWAPPEWSTAPAGAMEMPPASRLAWGGAKPPVRAAGYARGPVTPAGFGGWGGPDGASALDAGESAAMARTADLRAALRLAYALLDDPGYGAPRPVAFPVYYPAPAPAGMVQAIPAMPALPGPVAGYGGWNGALPAGLPPLAELGGQSAPDAPAPVPLSPGLAEGRVDRWSADMWMLARKESAIPLASGRPVYGGSQAGAVLRYRIAPSSGHRPLAYLRASAALGAVRESEIALGVGARPVPAIPITLAAEARGFRSASGRKSFRPAALAYTELPPFALPLGFTGEAYGQAGYVGGAFKTGFVDGQIRADRPLLDMGDTRLRIGGGIWGGAQKGASRLDIGPSASAMVDIWGTPSRVSVDWRFRLMGDAQPESGPALTISAGF